MAAPDCCALSSRSCIVNRASSSTAKAKGKPTSRADVVSTHAARPANAPIPHVVLNTVDVTFDTAERAPGGTMSFSADKRSASVSSRGSSSSDEATELCKRVPKMVSHESSHTNGELGTLDR